ncbi:Cas10/Cmr2 second palm domain-containing protein [Acetivibrio saccincola]|jgi:hypothetical protein|uniref:Cas10/Cmr2 second palm domain-containing protein n=1 Tax=Acetivibrio saccincola TaxID=1677857 RepID=A0A2K9E3I5_9FIRM|nr:hypothetical protein [Acetivibrio saccincola]AUG56938.1 hypothetical protein HVS_05025 [Acetivibrio saccincola]NLW26729.1 hypothetical protein [Acetivibrio saccincola]PQQ66962.1 hypothetical protein B9R14_09580 [Acetivibrio saccincola]HQD29585.1 hypothetical protein [Acetivibrio saccincola]
MGFLNILEVSRKQYYIFKSNKLKENIGASEIIAFVTEELPQEICKKHNGSIVSSGGGNVIFYFENEDDNKNFTKEYSKYLLNEFPMLEFFITSIEFDPCKSQIIGKIRELYTKLEKKKAKRDQYSYIVDFGITEKCSSTKLPAIKKDKNSKEFYSGESWSKVKMYKDNEDKFKKYAIDIKDLGISKNEKSYIAITYIDGNRMGKRIKKLRDKYQEKYTENNVKEVNDEYIKAFNDFSEEVKTAFEKAYDKMVEVVKSKSEYLIKSGLNIKEGVVPIRKIILAGDDVCYITDARIALECAYIFINELEKHYAGGEKITAGVGIAMVKEKYPFFKTYELAEELCKNAKSGIPDEANESRIDWHIVQGEYNNNLTEIREVIYKTHDNKNLSLRPLVISENSNYINQYILFKKDIENIQNKVPRSKVKGMLKEMKKGEKHLDTYIEINQLYKALGEHRIGAKTGFVDGKCVLFDAIEVMDYFISLS